MFSFLKSRTAMQFVVLIGLVSLFADMTYEGARSITGPYLASLGATGFMVGLIAGLGELIGYGLRLVSGFIADKTRRYWGITWFGYLLNILSVPLLALAGSWPFAATCMLAERAGKAIRVPARDAMLSFAVERMGAGWGFGLHESLDRFGAMLGPFVVSFIVLLTANFKYAFAWLAIPAFITLLVLYLANRLYPRPEELEVKVPNISDRQFAKIFWLYTMAGMLIAAGYADFPLIAFHFAKAHILNGWLIPLSYSLAMGVSALSALVFGKLYDRLGIGILLVVVFLAGVASPLVFLGNVQMALFGMAVWGLGMGSQSALLKALIVRLVPGNKRASAYGIFNMAFGLAWFLGSLLLGALYDHSIESVALISTVLQWLALPLIIIVKNKIS